jgi:hypothetical protein
MPREIGAVFIEYFDEKLSKKLRLITPKQILVGIIN